MKQATLAALVVLAATAAMTSPASAALRAPQVAVVGGNLQTLLTSVSPGINVATQQEDIQTWTCNASNNIQLTLMFEAGNDPGADNSLNNAIGIFNDGEFNTPFLIFPASAQPGWSASVTFFADDLIVNLLNASHNPVSQTTQSIIKKDSFVYYDRNGGTTSFGRDFLHGDQARVLVFAGTGVNTGGWFLCFEDGLEPENADEAQDFDDAIVFVHAVNPATPAVRSTWGALKSRFR